MKNTLIVNLFGAPGVGKSTGASYIFSKLKLLGYDAELVTEFAKEKVWEKNEEVLSNQVYVLGEQSLRISRCYGKVDIIITDSPLLLNIIYNKQDTIKNELEVLANKIFELYDNVNFLLKRVKPYNTNGRLHSKEESDEMYSTIKNLIADKPYCEVNGDLEGYDFIIYEITKAIKERNL